MNKTLKKILSITLCLMIVLSCGAVGLTAAYAETTITMEGDGSASDPYQITTYEQLCEFSAFVDESSNHSGACAKLMNDISYSGDSVFHTIDDLNGCFDGQGHSISGLILRNVGEAGGFIAGLYTDGVLKNLVLNNVRISSRCDGDAKIFVWLNSGTIENCILTGTVEVFDQSTEEDDYEYLRGIYVFTDVNEGTIRNCVNMANISRPGDTVCGIAGTNRSIITGCCNYGNFNGKNTAGICYSNNGELSSCVNFGEITGSVKASGIALNAYKNEHITIEPTITDCYNAGKVVCTENSPAAFMLVNENNECVFSNIYFDSLTSGCTDSYATSKSTYKLKGKGVISTLGFSSLEWTELAYDYPLPTGVYNLMYPDNNAPIVKLQINKSSNEWEVSYDNGTTWEPLGVNATGADGVGIASIDKTGTDGNVDTYTITLTNNKTYTFTVTNGTNGKDGTNGTDGKDGTNGTDGKDGTDGVGIESTTINDNGELIIKLTNGNEFNLGKITGKDGTDGKDGENGADGEKGEKGDTGAQGESGKDGKDGVDGKDATTIVSSHYNEKGELILVMSDGTEINSGNPTRQTFTLFMQRIINFFKSIFAVIKGWF